MCRGRCCSPQQPLHARGLSTGHPPLWHSCRHWGKWAVITDASPAGGKKGNPKPALQWSSAGKGNGETILPSYISRSPGKQRTTLCLKWGSLNKSWLSQSFILQTSLAVAVTAPLRGKCAIWVAKGSVGTGCPWEHLEFITPFFPVFPLCFQPCLVVYIS